NEFNNNPYHQGMKCNIITNIALGILIIVIIGALQLITGCTPEPPEPSDGMDQGNTEVGGMDHNIGDWEPGDEGETTAKPKP
ncbi:hypothetical protein, partial [Bacteroides fragilis]|uniref:hypothetical protein n=1 Tax=Bacteroides fragilis TaxID=817 RepID=UPI000516596D